MKILMLLSIFFPLFAKSQVSTQDLAQRKEGCIPVRDAQTGEISGYECDPTKLQAMKSGKMKVLKMNKPQNGETQQLQQDDTVEKAMQSHVIETTKQNADFNTQQASFSEALYFPQMGASTFTLTPSSATTKKEYKYLATQNLEQIEYRNSTYQIGFERGLTNSDAAIKLQTSIGTLTKDTTLKSVSRTIKFTGLSDLLFDLKGLTHLSETTNLVYGAQLGYSPEKSKQANTKINGNLLSGGNSLSPFLSIERKNDFGSIGGKLSYKIQGTRFSTFESQNFTSERTGGNEAVGMVFAEMAFSQQNKFGATFTYMESASSTLSEDHDGVKDTFDLDGYKSYTSGLYARVNLGSNYSLVPMATYEAVQTETINNLKYNQFETVTLSLALNAYF